MPSDHRGLGVRGGAALVLASAGTARASTGLGGMGSALAFLVVAGVLYGALALATLLGGTRNLAWRLGVLGACLATLVVALSHSGSDVFLVALVAPVIGLFVLLALPGAKPDADG